MNNYFEELNEKFDRLSDEEFKQLLIESGLNECPYEDEDAYSNFSKKSEEIFDIKLVPQNKKKIKLVINDETLMIYNRKEQVA